MTTRNPSRRQALRIAGGSAVATAAVAGGATPAAAKVSYRPGRYPATAVLDVQARHLVNRFSYGITPELAAEVRAAGGHLAWFDQQLAAAVAAPADDLGDWWPDLHLDALTLWQRNVSGARGGGQVMWDYGRRSLVRRLSSPPQVFEVVAEFWENHLHVPTGADSVFTHRVAYGDLIRTHALGRFEDLLHATITSPAMLIFLNGASSTKVHPNENLGRELLELHTVGVGNFTEQDVKDAARILTGWRVDMYKSWDPYYSSRDHATGPVQVLGFTDPNGSADGREVTLRLLSYLARHPDTARRIARKLARTFVCDDPPQSLVDCLAATYLAHDTAIQPVLRALVRSAEFKGSVDQLVRDGDEDVLATYRLLGAQVGPPTADVWAANAIYWQVSYLGLAPFSWPRPDGQPLGREAWSSPTRVIASMALHWNMANAYWPTVDVQRRAPKAWLPRSSMPFRDLVDHVSRLVLHRPSTATLLKACCEATEMTPAARVRPDSDLLTWRWPRLVAAVLDSPAFYQR